MAPSATPFWLAGAGFFFSYLNSKWAEERKARIERVNEQLRLFYGPLIAAVSATKSAYDALVAAHSPDGTRAAFVAAVQAAPAGGEARAYRLWVREVLQPLNEQAAAAVRDHIDELDDAALVPELMRLVAHVSALRVVLRRWADGELGAASSISYPDALLRHAEAAFRRLKARQAQLLGEQPPKALPAAGHDAGPLVFAPSGAGGAPTRTAEPAATAAAAGSASAAAAAASFDDFTGMFERQRGGAGLRGAGGGGGGNTATAGVAGGGSSGAAPLGGPPPPRSRL